VQVADQLGGSIQMLIYIGGVPGPSHENVYGQATDVWLAQFQNMLLSLIRLTDAVLTGMLNQGWGEGVLQALY
jgi:3-oxoacyl-[acyl-carrier protein] reductase